MGSRQIPKPGLQGTIAYLMGGRSYEGLIKDTMAFSLANEISSPVGTFPTEARVYTGTVFTQTMGLFCGGFGAAGISRIIDEMLYTPLQMRRYGAMLNNAVHSVAGVGTKVQGFLVGGAGAVLSGSSTPVDVAVQRVEVVTYATQTIAPNTQSLATPLVSPHNSTGIRATGFIYGGASQVWSQSLLLTSIQALTFATGAIAQISNTLPLAHHIHAAAGNKIKAIIMGGCIAPGSWKSNKVTAFTYSGQTAALVSQSLAESKQCMDGGGSNLAAYGFGGDSDTSGAYGTSTIDKVDYGSEAVTRLGTQLPKPAADQGCVGDYSASLY
jgi:hypothetical protein